MNILPWVKGYQGLGWTILPCAADTKYPFVNWRDYQEKRPTDTDWEVWIPRTTGLALITGKLSGIIVVDVDTTDNPFDLNSTVICRTQSGGRHYYYKHTEEIRNTVRIEGAPVDFRGDGGLVIIPPTVYQTRSYSWLRPPTKEAMSHLPDLPANVRQYLKKIAGIPVTGPRVSLQAVIGTVEGSRNDQLYRSAMSILNKHPESEWKTLGWGTIVTLNATFKPPLPEAEVRMVYEQAYKRVKNYPKSSAKPQPVKTAIHEYDQVKPEDLRKVVLRETLPILPSERFSFPSGFYVICGNPGSGKGFFAIWLARRFFALKQKRTVLYSLEMPESLVRQRMLQAWSDLTEGQYLAGESTFQGEQLIQQNVLAVYPFGEDDIAYQTPENFQKDVAEQYLKGYRIFMFDHLHELAGANDNDTNQGLTDKWGKAFQQTSKLYPDIWLIVFAQPNSAAARKRYLTKNDMLGSKSISHKAEFFLSLNRMMELDAQGEIAVDGTHREVILYVDKNRITSSQHIGISLYFDETGNFSQEQIVLPPDVSPKAVQLQDDYYPGIIYDTRRLFGIEKIETVEE